MWNKVWKGIQYPSRIPFKIDRYLGNIRAKYEFQSDSQVSLFSKITAPHLITIGSNTVIDPFTVIKPQQSSGIDIGENCTLHEFGFLAGNIEIGDGVRIAQKVSIHSFNHQIDPESPIHEQDLEHGKITIGDDVWIGCNVTILKDVEIGKGAVIGAGSVVTSDVEPYDIVVGNPAERIDTRK